MTRKRAVGIIFVVCAVVGVIMAYNIGDSEENDEYEVRIVERIPTGENTYTLRGVLQFENPGDIRTARVCFSQWTRKWINQHPNLEVEGRDIVDSRPGKSWTIKIFVDESPES
ncbi:hypothetical protein AKJ65_00545 [candidate division MSBL1 archaeon SCGC-AAA259E19]|uniref:Uncharacterized protein n=1 Tax=candidate division MSBL1 archaeon SCGC-AAA259E19 TaxID=1698264 RepID=A0A133UNT6_9EURY|nr:hypothetical protein AKJ65_00545 [candidate division MSBL1 archaeon SCGC-AAA259E19]